MVVARRMLLLFALLFWQGGFLFYAGVVVPVAADVFGSHLQQAWVTRVVTNYLNLGGGAALLVWAWDLAASRAGRLAWLLWLVLFGLLVGLVALHVALDAHLDPNLGHVEDRPRFYALHRWYLMASGLQWLAATVLLGVTVAAWRRADRAGAATSR